MKAIKTISARPITLDLFDTDIQVRAGEFGDLPGIDSFIVDAENARRLIKALKRAIKTLEEQA